jgi:serine/threonine protein phosphatase PrpC
METRSVVSLASQKKIIPLRYAAKTDTGRVRDHNEDNFGVLPEERVFVVADGMGGHESGEVASRMAVETLTEFYTRTRDDEATWPYRELRGISADANRLVCAIRLANQRIYARSGADAGQRRMGTTIVAIAAVEDRAILGHAGDSRCYRVRDGKLEQLTRDHSFLEDMKRAYPGMSDEEQRAFPHKNVITRALGMRDDVEVEVQEQPLLPGDRLLLCSDGLCGLIDDAALLAGAQLPDLQSACDDLVARANAAGGTDNVTVILVEAAR